MNGNPDQHLPSAEASRWRPRRLVAAIVVVHLILAFVSQAILSLGHSSKSWPDIYAQLIIAGLFGLHIGQMCLLASWAAFSGQTWFPRTLRFLSLAAWLFLVDALGAYLVEGDIAKSLIEEFAAYELLLILPPLFIFVAFGILSRRRFLNRATQHLSSHQFSTKHLLLITADVAAMLALGRVVLSWKPDHFWNGLTSMRPEELIPVAASLTVLPAVFYGLTRHRTWTRFLILTVYFLLASFLVACAQTRYGLGLFGLPSADDWLPGLFLQWLDYFGVHVSAAATILFTFYLLRRIGYDFRRPDEGPRGRSSSSKARSSAASASA